MNCIMGTLSLLKPTQSDSPVHPLFLQVKKKQTIALTMDISFFYILVDQVVFHHYSIRKRKMQRSALRPHPVSAFCFWILCHLWL